MRRASLAVATAALAAAGVIAHPAPATAAGFEIGYSDPTRDVRLHTAGSYGPAFTPRIDPLAIDLGSVRPERNGIEVETSDTTIYVRVTMRHFYGAARVSNGQQGAQRLSFEMAGENAPDVRATVRWHLTGPPTIDVWGAEPGDTRCAEPASVTASTTQNWVLLRLPLACDSGADSGNEGFFVTTTHTIDQLGGSGAITSRRTYIDEANAGARY